MDTYSLNIARLEARADHLQRYYHWARVDLGQINPELAQIRAEFIKVSFEKIGTDIFKFTLTCTPASISTSVDL